MESGRVPELRGTERREQEGDTRITISRSYSSSSDCIPEVQTVEKDSQPELDSEADEAYETATPAAEEKATGAGSEDPASGDPWDACSHFQSLLPVKSPERSSKISADLYSLSSCSTLSGILLDFQIVTTFLSWTSSFRSSVIQGNTTNCEAMHPRNKPSPGRRRKDKTVFKLQRDSRTGFSSIFAPALSRSNVEPPVRTITPAGILDSFSLCSWSFDPADWQLVTPVTSKKVSFPLTVAATHAVFKELQAQEILPQLSVKWDIGYNVGEWLCLFKRLWSAGLHRRDSLFLWRVLAKGFFTGGRAALMSVDAGICRSCRAELEGLLHLFFVCLVKQTFRLQISAGFPVLREVLGRMQLGLAFPLALPSILSLGRGKRLLYLLIITTALRLLWKQRCKLLFDSLLLPVSCKLVVIGVSEFLTVQFSNSGRRRQQVNRQAMVELLQVRHYIPAKFLLKILAVV
ncbi:hypothetical protein R1sor_014183 [Riccia sorocarpa]|uniref:Reverse transcriptase zinc-binding domain-containing protein n=1 Tax=Riccia sorocarpa TaxID=122646 RepID=A0ABD3HET6_9MARC